MSFFTFAIIAADTVRQIQTQHVEATLPFTFWITCGGFAFTLVSSIAFLAHRQGQNDEKLDSIETRVKKIENDVPANLDEIKKEIAAMSALLARLDERSAWMNRIEHRGRSE
jgi:hypothetical protein